MLYALKRLLAVIKSVDHDTHLWCLSVIGAALLLCFSFFSETSPGRLVAIADGAQSAARNRIIEYSSVLGGLSKIDSLGEDEVDEIAQAIPEHSDAFIGSFPADDILDLKEDIESDQEYVATRDSMVDVTRVYSAEAVDALERLVQCEAATEDIDGKALVASVVLNRVDTGIWGDDILSVIEAPGQFQPVDSGAYKVTEVDSDTKEAVLLALLDEDISHGALYFQKSAAKVWGDKQYLFRHGSHSFYK